jgi:alpha-glucosidase (family GH31 glycosyl hydrolase)
MTELWSYFNCIIIIVLFFHSDHANNLKGTIFGLDMQTVLDLDCTKINPLAHATEWGRKGNDRGIHQNDIMCEWGLVSRTGWAIIDDAANMVIDPSTDWWEGSPGTSNHNDIDQYIFAHGTDYTAALGDYALIGGRAPMPPRFTLGTMWDRWYDPISLKLFFSTRNFRSLLSIRIE